LLLLIGSLPESNCLAFVTIPQKFVKPRMRQAFDDLAGALPSDVDA
jgi:hypothetical protein